MLVLLNKWDIVVEFFALRYTNFTFTFTVVWIIDSKRSYVYKLWLSRVIPKFLYNLYNFNNLEG